MMINGVWNIAISTVMIVNPMTHEKKEHNIINRLQTPHCITLCISNQYVWTFHKKGKKYKKSLLTSELKMADSAIGIDHWLKFLVQNWSEPCS